MRTYPATPDAVRVGPSQQQFLTPRQKGQIIRHVAAHYDPFTERLVRWLLFDHAWQNGVCDPALETIAKGTRMGLTTVKDRLRRIIRDGVLARIRRGIALGKRFVQWTNAYLFALPAQPAAEAEPPPPPDPAPPQAPVRCEAARRPPLNNEDLKNTRPKAVEAAQPAPARLPADPNQRLILAEEAAKAERRAKARQAFQARQGITRPPPWSSGR